MLEIGKYYQQRNGVVVGPLETYTGRMSKNGFVFCCSAEGIAQRAWREDGSWSSYKDHKAEFDIISGVEFIPLSQQPKEGISEGDIAKEEIMSKEFKLEVGKYYKDRDGIVLGPMISRPSARYPFEDENGATYTENGLYVEGEEHDNDLIKEVRNPYEIKPEEIVKITDEAQSTEDVKTDADLRPTIEEALSAIQRGDDVTAIDSEWNEYPIRANHAIQRLLNAKSFEIKVKQPVVKYKYVFQYKGRDPFITSLYFENDNDFLEEDSKDAYDFFEPIQATRKEF